MAYTTIDNPELYFQAKLYTGSGSSGNAITLDGDENMQPDWVWLKSRSDTEQHTVWDSVRGGAKRLMADASNAEYDNSTQGLQSFDSDGFTCGASDQYNKSSQSVVAWNWKAGGSASSNTNGSINSSVSVNTTAGFSIVSWTHDGGNSTIGHGLGAIPQVVITKERNNSGSWNSYFKYVGNGYRMVLQGSNAKISSSIWNSTTPTANVFSMNDSITSTMIAYCFTEKKGYSKFGGYTGNADTNFGPFIYTGFRPALVIIKNTSGNNWGMLDNKRDPHNGMQTRLHPNLTNADNTGAGIVIDFLSNGFKCRSNDGLENGAADILYMAFAESPFVNSNGVPNNAR
tara:strand:+ start:1491 stop:2519 length:1029 start_codon:yes stop_codon:yes gene_type:complete